MKITVITILFLLTSCSDFAGINWHDELMNTHWTGYKNTQFKVSCSSNKMQGHGYNVIDGRLETFTRLNEDGLRIMETEGCSACHQHGGEIPSILSVMKYKELSADQHTQDAINCILENK